MKITKKQIPNKTCSTCAHLFRGNSPIVGRCPILGVSCKQGEAILDNISNFKKAGYEYTYPIVNLNFGCIYWEEKT